MRKSGLSVGRRGVLKTSLLVSAAALTGSRDAFDELARKYPAVASDLRAIAASVQRVAPAGVDPG